MISGAEGLIGVAAIPWCVYQVNTDFELDLAQVRRTKLPGRGKKREKGDKEGGTFVTKLRRV